MSAFLSSSVKAGMGINVDNVFLSSQRLYRTISLFCSVWRYEGNLHPSALISNVLYPAAPLDSSHLDDAW